MSDTLAASTDFGNVSLRVPGIHPLIGIAPEGTGMHTEQFALAANTPEAVAGALDAAFGLAFVAVDYLVDDELARACAPILRRPAAPWMWRATSPGSSRVPWSSGPYWGFRPPRVCRGSRSHRSGARYPSDPTGRCEIAQKVRTALFGFMSEKHPRTLIKSP